MGAEHRHRGGYSTAGDLLRFAEALESGKLISKASLAAATTPHKEEDYGFGFGIQGERALKSYGHSGGAPGPAASAGIATGAFCAAAVSAGVSAAAAGIVALLQAFTAVPVCATAGLAGIAAAAGCVTAALS